MGTVRHWKYIGRN